MTCTERELDDSLFKELGFDVSKEPFVKIIDNGLIVVHKNYIRDGSGNYDGYLVERPETRLMRTVGDFMKRTS